jgi:hypothetical protein
MTVQVTKLPLQQEQGIICCTEPGLTETLYTFYIHIFNNM